MGRGTKAQFEQRVGTVHSLLLAGTARREILRLATDQGWGITEHGIDYIIRVVNKRIKRSAAYDREREVGVAIERLNNLYRMAMQSGDHAEARKVQKELNTLLGLPEAAKINMTHDFGDLHEPMQQWRESILNMGTGKPDESVGADE